MTHVSTAIGNSSSDPESPSTRLLAGVTVSDTPLVTAVVEYVAEFCEPPTLVVVETRPLSLGTDLQHRFSS